LAASHHFFQSSRITSGKNLLNLFCCGFSTEAVQDELHQFEVIGRGHLAEGFQIGGLPREDMVFGDGLERLGGKRQIHGVAGLVRKIDREAGEYGIDGLDLSEPPASVHAESAFDQFR